MVLELSKKQRKKSKEWIEELVSLSTPESKWWYPHPLLK